MTHKIANIAKNTSYFTLALIIQKVISFTYFAILARYLAPDLLGKYYFAISSVMIFSVILDMGLTNVLTREVSKEHDKASKLLGSVLSLKIPLTIITLFFIFIYAKISGFDELTSNLLYLAAISMMLDSYTNVFFAVMRGFHNLKYESISSVVFQLILLSFGLMAIHLDMGLYYLISALLLAGTFSFSFSASLLRFKWKVKFFANTDFQLAKSIFLLALPFAGFVVLQRFYMYLDSVLLAFLAGEYYVGLYQIPFKIIFALQFLPMAFVASLYPAFSAYWKNNKEQIPVTLERALNYLIIISVPISAGVIALSGEILSIFKPEYMDASLALKIIMVSLVFVFLNFPIGSLLNACDRQKNNMINMAITLFASVVLNFLLIPKFNIIGAAITVLASNGLMFFLGLYYIPKITNYRFGNNILIFLKSFIAASAMLFFIFYSKSFLNIILLIPLSGIIYFAALFFLGGYNKEDIYSIKKSFSSK